MPSLRVRLTSLLRSTERYTKTDMVYLFQGGFWLMISQFVAMAASLLLAIAFGNLATPDTYGNYKYVLSLWGLCSAFSLTGVGTAITQSTALGYEGSFRHGVSLNLKWSLGSVFIALATAAYYFFIEQNLFVATSLCIVALFSPFLSSFSLFDPFLIGKKEFKRHGIYLSLNGLIPVLVLIGTLFITDRAIVLVSVFFLSNFIADLITYLFALRHAKNDQRDEGMFKYSKHLSLMGIVGALADKIDSIATFVLLGPINLAIYTFATAIPEQIKQVIKFVAPLSLARFAERSLPEIRQTIWRRILLLGIAVAVGITAYIVAAPLIFKVLFPLYTESIVFSQWYALSIVVTVITAPLTSVLQAHKKTRELYILSYVSSLSLIILLPIGTYLYGIAGAIGSQIIYRLITATVVLVEFNRAK
ncbi:hypothetical protein KKD81_02910 [Patescibacteria group bacterium]|nr:hypothetical protein [Patescibacteria group bacterium]